MIGAHRIPQQLWPAAMYSPLAEGTCELHSVLSHRQPTRQPTYCITLGDATDEQPKGREARRVRGGGHTLPMMGSASGGHGRMHACTLSGGLAPADTIVANAADAACIPMEEWVGER